MEALILGVVEGITEFLPISSTGHLIIASDLMKIQNTDANKAFEIVIQGAAIMAVIWHYRQDLIGMAKGFFRREPGARRKILALFLGFLPSALLGLAFSAHIKEYLFGPRPVVYAMIIGGLLILFIEKHFEESGEDFEPSPLQAFYIGCFQCLALWPGMSRSMTTILGGRMIGLNSMAAARYSFLLAIPTLLAASAYDFIKHREVLLADTEQLKIMAIGLVASYVVALLVIRAFLKFLGQRSLNIFGWYRIAAGVLLFFLFS